MYLKPSADVRRLDAEALIATSLMYNNEETADPDKDALSPFLRNSAWTNSWTPFNM